MVPQIIITLAVCFAATISVSAKSSITLGSPDGNIRISVNAGNHSLVWSVRHGDKTVLNQSKIGYTLADGTLLGAKWGKCRTSHHDSASTTHFYRKNIVRDNYNALNIDCGKGVSIEFRAYDDGVAYRVTGKNTPEQVVTADISEFCFPHSSRGLIPYINDNRGGDPFMFSFESYYDDQSLDGMYADSLAITPCLVITPDSLSALILDTDIEQFAGMFLKKGDKPFSLKPVYAPMVTEGRIGGFDNLNLIPTSRAPYIAVLKGDWQLPWKAIAIADEDKKLLMSDLMYNLSEPSRIADTDWIRPGKTTWEWWNNCNIVGVPFKRGINNDTYKYHIDFASAHGIEYILIDEGWSSLESIMEPIDDIDINGLVSYASSKGVGVLLWASWKAVHKDVERVFAHYASIGVKGFKVDFFDSDDHRMVADMYKIADCASRNKLVLDYHGMKANGMQRAYPNILSFEGVKGLENNRWVSNDNTPGYECTLPFIRMQAGPMDYTPGGMRNATLANFNPCDSHPMTYGTRARQIALYTIFESPLSILADSPSLYTKEAECFSFMQRLPTVHDQTLVLDARIGHHIIIARRKDDKWYLAAINNWDKQTYDVALDFLHQGTYKAEILGDGVNSDFEATDYTMIETTVTSSDSIKISLAPGGGWSAIFSPL